MSKLTGNQEQMGKKEIKIEPLSYNLAKLETALAQLVINHLKNHIGDNSRKQRNSQYMIDMVTKTIEIIKK